MSKLGFRLALGAAFLLLPALASPAFACSCLSSGPPCQAYWESEVVFAGTPLSVSRIEVERDGNRIMQGLVRFRLDEAFRGVSVNSVEVITGAWGGDCGYDFEVGQKYLVYGYNIEGSPRIGTSICSRTQPLTEAREDLSFIRAVSGSPAGATIYGTAQRHTINLEDGGTREPAGPIEGAVVVASSGESRREATTGSDGLYRFPNLPPGRYTVRATLPAKLSPFEEQTVEVHDRGCAEVDINAVTDGRIAGRLLDAQGLPLDHKYVELLPIGRDGKLLRGLGAFTKKDGSFTHTQIPPGRYVLGINTSGAPDEYLPYRKTFYPSAAEESAAEVYTLDEGQHLSGIEFRLPAPLVPREITGTVVWPDGRPAAGAELRLEDAVSGRSSQWGVKTDRRGRFKLHGYEGLLYRVEASIPADPNWRPDSGQGVELLVTPKAEVTPSARTRALRLVIDTRGDGVRRTTVVVGAGRKPSPAVKRRKRP